jgi:hypothetical protein
MLQLPAPGGVLGSLNLIHRNKVPNPVLVRATARFDCPEGMSFKNLPALLFLMERRLLDARSTK